MKFNATVGIITACVGLSMASTVDAQVEIAFEQAESGEGVPSVAQVLNVKTTSDWTAASMVIKLNTGAIIQDRYVAVDPPVEVSSLRIGESEESETAKAARGMFLPLTAAATGPEAFGKAVLVAGGGEHNLGGESLWLDSSRLDLCWYNHSQDDIGWGRIGRFTLSDTAVGTWTLAVMQAQDDRRYVFTGKVIHGRMTLDE